MCACLLFLFFFCHHNIDLCVLLQLPWRDILTRFTRLTNCHLFSLENSDKLKDIVHQRDVWHGGKGICKKLRVCPLEDQAGVTHAISPISLKLSQIFRLIKLFKDPKLFGLPVNPWDIRALTSNPRDKTQN